MKADPSPTPQSESPMDRLDRAFRTVLAVSKDELLKREAELKQSREKKRKRKTG